MNFTKSIIRGGGVCRTIDSIVCEPEDTLQDKQLPITCPLCGKRHEFPLENLKEGATLQCPRCQVKLSLHGHMWQEIQSAIAMLEQKN
jgi:hypothetical protein